MLDANDVRMHLRLRTVWAIQPPANRVAHEQEEIERPKPMRLLCMKCNHRVESTSDGPRYLVMDGCGVLPPPSPEAIKARVLCARFFRKHSHGSVRAIYESDPLWAALDDALREEAAYREIHEVDFVYFNLGSNEIVVKSIEGLPRWANPGLLIPVHSGDQPPKKIMDSLDAVCIESRITIKWQDNGTNGFNDYWESHESTMPGTEHKAEFKRDDLGIPATLKKGGVRFTYLGNDKWRIEYAKAGFTVASMRPPLWDDIR